MLDNVCPASLNFMPENFPGFGGGICTPVDKCSNPIFSKNDNINFNINQGPFQMVPVSFGDQALEKGYFSFNNFSGFDLNNNQMCLADKTQVTAITDSEKLLTPVQKLMELGKKYNVPFKEGDDLDKYQQKVFKSIITVKAKALKIPVNIALGIAGHESGWQMWDKIDGPNPTVVAGVNSTIIHKKRITLSTDWGVMQVNDKANAKAFPRAKEDPEYNVEFGLRLLASIRKESRGNQDYGLGDWDNTIAAYNLGHSPNNSVELITAKKYVSAVNRIASKTAKS